MNVLLHIVFAVATAAVGCWMSGELLPAGSVRMVAQMLSVLCGFGFFWSSRKMFP